MQNKHIHFVGILGSGASAVALIAQAQGYQVSGCDTSSYSEYKDELEAKGIAVKPQHSEDHIAPNDILVLSPAVLQFDVHNAEVAKAREIGIPVVTWQQFAGQYLHQNKFVIAVAGTHGKSTTTAMLAQILIEAGLDPTVQLGAIVPVWEANYRTGASKYYVIEADEYAENFLAYRPDIIAITNIEYDHPDFFKTQADMIAVFQKFLGQLKPNGKVLFGSEVAHALYYPTAKRVQISYYDLAVPGDYNQENASIAAAVAKTLDIDDGTIAKALASYTGLGRRLSLVGKVHNIAIYDDYAHHPTALLKTVAAARSFSPTGRLWVIFQPHMYSRTKMLFDSFVMALRDLPADQVLVTDVFGSREHDTGLVSSQQVVQAVNKLTVRYSGNLDATFSLLQQEIKPFDTIICIGAGDIITLSKRLVKALEKTV